MLRAIEAEPRTAETIHLPGDEKMMSPMKASTAFAPPASWLTNHDSSWYGTLGVLTAGFIVLVGMVFTL